jgi:electron transport complex protein RnfE
MGLATTFVLIGSNCAISLLKSFIPEKVRIPAYVVVIATFVTIVKLLMEAFLPSLNDALGIFIPLIVVNCIILARAEAFASKHSVIESLADGLGMGLGFTLSLTALSSIPRAAVQRYGLWLTILGGGFEPALIIGHGPRRFHSAGTDCWRSLKDERDKS